MKNIKFYLAAIACALFLQSCYQEVRVDLPPYKQQIVVNGLISDKDVTRIQVSRSISSLDTGNINFITQASVQLYDENNVLYEVLSYNSFSGGFIGTKPAISNRTYTIKVNTGGKEVTGSTRITSGSQINNLRYIDSVGVDSSGFPIGQVEFTFNDIGGQDNFYRLNVEYFDDIKKEFFALDMSQNVFLDAQGDLTDNGYVFDDESFRGQAKTIAIDVPFGLVNKNGDFLFRVSLEALNQDYTLYEKSRRLYNRSFGGFFTEPVDLYSNIKSGLGIFGGVSVSRDTLR